jgi:alanine racemase
LTRTVENSTRTVVARLAGDRRSSAARPAGSTVSPDTSDGEHRRRALDQLIRPTRAEIDLAALKANLASIGALAPRAGVLAVLKGNAYGHGAIPIARALEESNVRMLGVALVEEGLELRNAGVRAPILVLGGAYQGGYELLVEHGLTPTVFRADHLEQLAHVARARGAPVAVHLKVDTGMGRLGLLSEELDTFLDRAARIPEVRIEGLLSHFANADVADSEMTREQIVRFRSALAALRARGIDPELRHLSNSAGLIERPELRDDLELNLVRPGVMLYGVAPAPEMRDQLALRPVLSWKTAITHLKRVKQGTPISYGGTWIASRESVIATLPVGYADGYDRRYSNRAQVLIRGRRAPLAGRVCMDMVMADVTDVPGAAVGDEVVLLGEQGGERISAEDLAELSDTIPYEILCRVGGRVPRVVR